jgi:hypothetical protein
VNRPFLLLPSLVAVTLLFAACGSDTENPPPADAGSPCEATQATICKKACECGAGVGCTFRDPGEATVTFASEANCNSVLVGSACNAQVEEIDYNVCGVLLQSAECKADADGVDAVERPPVCKPKPIVGTGGAGGVGGGG